MQFRRNWSLHTEQSYYLSLGTNSYIIINNNNTVQNETGIVHCETSEDSYRAVTENIPKNFTAALRNPTWGEPARIEFDTIVVDTKAVVEINSDIAKAHIDKHDTSIRREDQEWSTSAKSKTSSRWKISP